MDGQTIILSAAVGIVTSAVTAYITTRLKMKEEREKWDRELKLKYADAMAMNQPAADALAKQFAVGVVITQRPLGQRDRVFVPKGGRITIGRNPAQCQVVLHDPQVSRVAAMIEAQDNSL